MLVFLNLIENKDKLKQEAIAEYLAQPGTQSCAVLRTAPIQREMDRINKKQAVL